MARKKAPETSSRQPAPKGITRINVAGFKSILDQQSIEIRPLTVLSGANSSGKSSMMQPLLLLKQTLEAQYDPGALLLDGPNVGFSQAEQLLARRSDGQIIDTFSVGITLEDQSSVKTFLKKGEGGIFEVEQTMYKDGLGEYCVQAGMSLEELHKEMLTSIEKTALSTGIVEGLIEAINKLFDKGTPLFQSAQTRCFLDCFIELKALPTIDVPVRVHTPLKRFVDLLHQMLHLPGLRGNPQRTYPLIPLGPNFTNFSGTFENYTASVISYWQRNKQQDKLDGLNRDLTRLGLTSKVEARNVSGVHIELLVNRLVHGPDGVEDMVNIVDVGFGVSQALPVLVALHLAEPGQLVYIEQPEIHLHPRAQVAIAEVVADAARQGKHIVIETHSDLVLSSIQALVAEGKLATDLVKLHWFEQNPDGSTKISSANLDRAGAFGDWPEDFHSVILNAENRYLNAAEAQLMGE